jgi:hypothetical protein
MKTSTEQEGNQKKKKPKRQGKQPTKRANPREQQTRQTFVNDILKIKK